MKPIKLYFLLFLVTILSKVALAKEIKSEVKIKQKKAGESSLSVPLSKNSIGVIKKYLMVKDQDEFVLVGQIRYFTKKPVSSQQYVRIVKGCMEKLSL